VKHAQPVLDPSRPAREWTLGRDGEEQAAGLAEMLRSYLPFDLVSSLEPKARRTSEIVADKLGLATVAVKGLGELDRPALPILSRQDHEALNARVFLERDRAVIGAESAASALDRFKRALSGLLDRTPPPNVVVITHGTVIALLVADANPAVDAFTLWKRLQCASFVVLERASLELREVVDTA
jgi:broad specificity phosphatase PhoE